MTDLSRRALFRGAGALGTAAAAGPPQPAAAQARAAPATAGGPYDAHGPWRQAAGDPKPATYRFFNTAEAAFVEAAVERLIPEDEWPGATWAGIPAYIDGQLAGAYGSGARLYAAGPWEPGLPSQGYQLALNPAQLYRTALAAIARQLSERKMDFAKAGPEAQDAFLRELDEGRLDLDGVPSAEFFETLLANTIEGFFSDPTYGGNRAMVGWRMIGFPGAYAAYLNTYTDHGVRFEREPLSIASEAGQNGEHHHG